MLWLLLLFSGLLVQRLSLPHPAAAEANDGHTAGTAIPVWSVAIIDTTAQLLSHQRRCEQLYGVFGLGHGVSPAAPPEVPGEGLEEGLTFTQRRERAETDARNLLLSRLWVCSGNRDGRLTMWNAVSGTPVFTVDLPVTQILSCGFRCCVVEADHSFSGICVVFSPKCMQITCRNESWLDVSMATCTSLTQLREPS
jgi:hypothetical protein